MGSQAKLAQEQDCETSQAALDLVSNIEMHHDDMVRYSTLDIHLVPCLSRRIQGEWSKPHRSKNKIPKIDSRFFKIWSLRELSNETWAWRDSNHAFGQIAHPLWFSNHLVSSHPEELQQAQPAWLQNQIQHSIHWHGPQALRQACYCASLWQKIALGAHDCVLQSPSYSKFAGLLLWKHILAVLLRQTQAFRQ